MINANCHFSRTDPFTRQCRWMINANCHFSRTDPFKQALRVLGLSAAQLQGLPKGAAEKAALAWWLRRRTTVSLRWVGQRLGMGHYTRVTQGVRRTERRVGRKLAGLRRKLEAAGSKGKA